MGVSCETGSTIHTVMPLRVIAGHRGIRATYQCTLHSACFSGLIGWNPGIYPRAVPGARL